MKANIKKCKKMLIFFRLFLFMIYETHKISTGKIWLLGIQPTNITLFYFLFNPEKSSSKNEKTEIDQGTNKYI